MTNAQCGEGKNGDAVHVLREVFPDISQEEFQELKDCFVALFATLHEFWMLEQVAQQDAARLDDLDGCDSLNMTV